LLIKGWLEEKETFDGRSKATGPEQTANGADTHTVGEIDDWAQNTYWTGRGKAIRNLFKT
jgi:hypothetical protein